MLLLACQGHPAGLWQLSPNLGLPLGLSWGRRLQRPEGGGCPVGQIKRGLGRSQGPRLPRDLGGRQRQLWPDTQVSQTRPPPTGGPAWCADARGSAACGCEVRCAVAAAPPPEARLEPTVLVALIAFTFDGLACDRPLTRSALAAHSQPPLCPGGVLQPLKGPGLLARDRLSGSASPVTPGGREGTGKQLQGRSRCPSLPPLLHLLLPGD